VVSVENPKFVHGNNTSWLEEGHDACRTDFTSASENMEWVIRSTSQIVALLSFEKILLAGGKLLPSIPAEDGTISPVDGVNIAQEHHVEAFVNSSAVTTSYALAAYLFCCSNNTQSECHDRALLGGKDALWTKRACEIESGCRYCSTMWTARCCLALLLPEPKQVLARKRRVMASFRAMCKQR